MSHGFEISGFKWIKKVGGVDEIEVLADELRAFLHRKYSGTDHGQVVRHLHKIGADNVYNPIKEKLDLVKWDGVDRIERLCNTLSPLDDFARSLIRKWLIQCIAMLYNDHSQYGAFGSSHCKAPKASAKPHSSGLLCLKLRGSMKEPLLTLKTRTPSGGLLQDGSAKLVNVITPPKRSKPT